MVFKYNDVSLLVFNMSVVLAFLSSSLNPALYLWRSRMQLNCLSIKYYVKTTKYEQETKDLGTK